MYRRNVPEGEQMPATEVCEQEGTSGETREGGRRDLRMYPSVTDRGRKYTSQGGSENDQAERKQLKLRIVKGSEAHRGYFDLLNK